MIIHCSKRHVFAVILGVLCKNSKAPKEWHVLWVIVEVESSKGSVHSLSVQPGASVQVCLLTVISAVVTFLQRRVACCLLGTRERNRGMWWDFGVWPYIHVLLIVCRSLRRRLTVPNHLPSYLCCCCRSVLEERYSGWQWIRVWKWPPSLDRQKIEPLKPCGINDRQQ